MVRVVVVRRSRSGWQRRECRSTHVTAGAAAPRTAGQTSHFSKRSRSSSYLGGGEGRVVAIVVAANMIASIDLEEEGERDDVAYQGQGVYLKTARRREVCAAPGVETTL